MPKARNINNMAIEKAANMMVDWVSFMDANFAEKVGEEPKPQRVRRVGETPASEIVQAVLREITPR